MLGTNRTNDRSCSQRHRPYAIRRRWAHPFTDPAVRPLIILWLRKR